MIGCTIYITKEEALDEELRLEHYYDNIPVSDIQDMYNTEFNITNSEQAFMNDDIIVKLKHLYKTQIHEFYKIKELLNL